MTEPTAPIDLASLTLDLPTITLGEMCEIEIQSGKEFTTLLRSRVGRRLIALFLLEYRSSGTAPLWSSLTSHRPLAPASSPSPSSPAGTPGSSPA